MVRLSFKKIYEKYILDGSKRTTCRIGNKSSRFHVGQIIDIVVGSRYKQRIIMQALLTKVKVLKFEELTSNDLVSESPDCRTVEGLRCTMFHINHVILKDDDIITIIKWKEYLV